MLVLLLVSILRFRLFKRDCLSAWIFISGRVKVIGTEENRAMLEVPAMGTRHKSYFRIAVLLGPQEHTQIQHCDRLFLYQHTAHLTCDSTELSLFTAAQAFWGCFQICSWASHSFVMLLQHQNVLVLHSSVPVHTSGHAVKNGISATNCKIFTAPRLKNPQHRRRARLTWSCFCRCLPCKAPQQQFVQLSSRLGQHWLEKSWARHNSPESYYCGKRDICWSSCFSNHVLPT